MDEKYTTLKLALTALFAALGERLGWKGIMLVLLAASMALDYFTGTLAAKRRGEWSSKVAREGIFNKAGMILVALVAQIADITFSIATPMVPFFRGLPEGSLFLPLVLAWYIITEIGSVLENAEKLGIPVPGWFLKAIAATKNRVDDRVEDKNDRA